MLILIDILILIPAPQNTQSTFLFFDLEHIIIKTSKTSI